MANSQTTNTPDTVGVRRPVEELTAALETALAAMAPALHGDSARELSPAEAEYLRSGGLTVERRPDADPIGQTAVEFAAIIAASLPSKAVAKYLGVQASKIRQWIMARELYSVKIDGRRLVPRFQLTPDHTLVPGIRRVNAALDPTLHPVEVFAWYTTPNADLVRASDDTPIAPLDWLKAGWPVEDVAALAAQLSTLG